MSPWFPVSSPLALTAKPPTCVKTPLHCRGGSPERKMLHKKYTMININYLVGVQYSSVHAVGGCTWLGRHAPGKMRMVCGLELMWSCRSSKTLLIGTRQRYVMPQKGKHRARQQRKVQSVHYGRSPCAGVRFYTRQVNALRRYMGQVQFLLQYCDSQR